MNVLEARRRMLGAEVYKKTVIGNPAIAQGSLARRYPGITMQGWTIQPSTTGAQLFNIYNLKQYVGGQLIELPEEYFVDGQTVVVTNSKSSALPGFQVEYKQGEQILNVTYRITVDTGHAARVFYKFIYEDGSESQQYSVATTEYSIHLTQEENIKYINIGVGCFDESGVSYTLSEIMVNYGSESLPYEPYTGGQPAPSPDYPQEIVSAGNWNEETGKYEYEIEVGGNGGSSQTVLLTSDRPLTKWDRLEKRGGQWEWVYKSKQIILNGTILNIIGNGTWGNIDDYKTIAFYSYINGTNNSQDIGVDMSRAEEALTNQFIYGHVYNSADVNKFTIDSSGGYIAFRVDADMLPDWSSEAPSNQPFIDWLDEKEQAGKPVTLLYPTIEETFAPLSASEQEQMNSLHTFRPTTVLSNDAGCEMSLTYKTKKSLEVTE